MTEEDKQLLLQDLVARLPYTPMVNLRGKAGYDRKLVSVHRYTTRNEFEIVVNSDDDEDYMPHNFEIEIVKPYLRPMESMTEEDLISYANYDFANDDTYKIVDYRCPPGRGFINLYCSSIRHPEERPVIFQRTRTSPLENWRGIDWLNERHFDYRNLIKMGLAIKAPDGMYNF